jgi:phospholipid/cholesterol/gamma-HCH transport system substrate-binding protein
MSYRLQEVKVGLMVVICLVLLIFFIIVISGLDLKKETVVYTTQLPYVGGLETGAPVRLGGVMVGRISAIVFPEENSKRIRLVLELDSKTPIKTDSKAYLTSLGMLGEFYLEIDAGSPNAQILVPGSEIPSMDVSTFTQISNQMSNMSVSAETTLVRINKMLGEENQQHLTNILANINKLMTDNSDHLTNLLQNLETLSSELVLVTTKIDTMLQQNDLALNSMIKHLDSSVVESQNLLIQTQNSLKSLDNMVTSKSSTYQSILNSLERSTYNFEEFSRSISERPWNLIRKSNPKPRAIPDK